MSMVDARRGRELSLRPAAIRGLEQVLYCAGVRCPDAVTVAEDIQADRYLDPGAITSLVSHRVAGMCLTCTECFVEPTGQPIDQEAVDRILAE